MSLNAEQTSNAQQIMLAADSLGLSAADTLKAKVIGIMTALTEAGLHVYTSADEPSQEGSSLGLFQQLTGWGSVETRENPYQSALLFYKGGAAGQRGLLSVPGWQNMNPWNAAQAVQQSGTSDGSNYQATYQTAIGYVNDLAGSHVPVTPGGTPTPTTTPSPTNNPAGFSIPIPGGPIVPFPIVTPNPLDSIIKAGDATGQVLEQTWTLLSALNTALPRIIAKLFSPGFWLRVGAAGWAVILLGVATYLVATAS